MKLQSGDAIVIDKGSYNTKMGFAGDDKQSLVTRNLYSSLKDKCGNEALK